MKKRPLLTLLLIICCLFFILAACSEPSEEDTKEGYFTINLSASENMRAAYPPTDTIDLRLVAKFRDTASGAEKTYTSDGSGKIQGKIDIGNYIVTMDVSLISDSSPYARGIAFDNPIEISSGQNLVKAYAYDVKNAAPPVISAKPQEKKYSFGDTTPPLEVSAYVNDGGVISYQWYSNITNNVSDATAISGATLSSYMPSTATPGTAWYYVVVTNSSTGKPTAINTVPVAITVSPGSSSGGTGTEADPFLVNDVTTLKKVGSGTDGWTLDAHYKQTADIDLASVRNWTPIGSSPLVFSEDTPPTGIIEEHFTGSYDGNGKTIKNLAINAPNAPIDELKIQGLFGCIHSGAVVKNLGVVNCAIIGIGGAIVGWNQGTVQNCYVTGSVSGNYAAGGLVAANNGTIRNCYVTANVSVISSDNVTELLVGGVAAVNSGTIQNCYATGNVSSNGDSVYEIVVGGMVGYNSGTIQNCYATGNVTGNGTSGDGAAVGGVVGYNSGTIQNCYATGNVSGNSNSDYGAFVGGVVGLAHRRGDAESTVQNCVALNPNISSTGGTGRVLGNLGTRVGNGSPTLANNYGRSDIKANGSSTTWTKNTASQEDGANITSANWGNQSWWRDTAGWNFTNVWEWRSNSLPILRNMPGTTTQNPVVSGTGGSGGGGSGSSGGTGTASDPFLVYDVATLRKVGTETTTGDWTLGAHYKQTANITLPAISSGGSNWTPIGTSSEPFFGSYDGNGKTISNLTINTQTEDYSQGLFGWIGIESAVKNVGLVNCTIVGYRFVGGVVGCNSRGTVQNCYVTGNVSGDGLIGGVVGINGGTMQNCYATGVVSGSDHVGGVAGSNSGTVQYCYATGSVSGNRRVGGVVGGNTDGTVQNCYATGTILGNGASASDYEDVGGVVGLNQGTVQDCYATGNVSGYQTIGGVVGLNQGTMQNCYATGNVSGYQTVGGVVGLQNKKNTTSIATAKNCVALNLNVSVSITRGTEIGRVLGYGYLTLANNYGRSDMKKNGGSTTWTNIGSDDLDGTNITSSNWSNQSWWRDTTGWDFTNVWAWGGSLPILRNMPGTATQNPTTQNLGGSR